MKPASTTRSGACRSISAASVASNASRVANAAWSTTAVATPRSAASARPRASPRLLITATMVPASAPCDSASASAVKFEPRPEISTTMRAIAMTRGGRLRDDGRGGAGRAHHDAPDRRGALAMRRERRERRVGVALGDDDRHADAAVEHAVHLGSGYVALALQPVEDRRLLPARLLQARGDAVGQHPRHVLDQAAAGDVRHALDGH